MVPNRTAKEGFVADQHEYDIVLTPQAEGGFTVAVPAFPDVVTEGETFEEARLWPRMPLRATWKPCIIMAGSCRRVVRERVVVQSA